MRMQSSLLILVSLVFSLVSSFCFADESNVTYSERYQLEIARNRNQPFDSSRVIYPSSSEDQQDLLCAMEGQIYVITNFAGLNINLADKNGHLDLMLFYAWTDSSHSENVAKLCDPSQEIKDFRSLDEITRCTPLQTNCNF